VLYVAVAVLAVMLLAASVRLAKHWSAPRTDSYWKQMRGWPWSEAAWLAACRSTIATFAAGLFLILSAVRPIRPFAASACVVALALSASTFLFNRPKWLVPPHLREGPGWFASRSKQPSV
jgi:hypothetical protein